MEQQGARHRRVVVAMKGHPGTGKTTLALSIAASLKCPLLDKDDVRDSTCAIEAQVESSTVSKLLNDLSYEVLWRMAKTQLGLGLSVVIDSPLSRRAHLDRVIELVDSFDGFRLVVVECKPKDAAEWCRRVEKRGKDGGCGSWHKPATWQDMERLLEGYDGCTDYDIGKVARLVLDTTAAGVGVADLVDVIVAAAIILTTGKRRDQDSLTPWSRNCVGPEPTSSLTDTQSGGVKTPPATSYASASAIVRDVFASSMITSSPSPKVVNQ